MLGTSSVHPLVTQCISLNSRQSSRQSRAKGNKTHTASRPSTYVFIYSGITCTEWRRLVDSYFRQIGRHALLKHPPVSFRSVYYRSRNHPLCAFGRYQRWRIWVTGRGRMALLSDGNITAIRDLLIPTRGSSRNINFSGLCVCVWV